MLGDIVYCQYLFGQGWDYNSYYKLNTKHKVVSIRLIYELIGLVYFASCYTEIWLYCEQVKNEVMNQILILPKT